MSALTDTGHRAESYPPEPTLEPVDSPSSLSAVENVTISNSSDYDWATFISAYAAGRWDPRRTPNPPRSCQQVLSDSHRLSNYELPTKPPVVEVSAEVPAENADSQKQTQETGDSSKPDDRPPSISPLPPSLSGQSVTSPGSIASLPSMPLRLPTHRFRNSFSTSLPNNAPNQSSAMVSDLRTTVATMRWAAARVDISPLALPSPERELADPLHGVTATIPGSHPLDTTIIDYAITPGGTRRPRLNGFWEGTIDVDNSAKKSTQLSAIADSPSETAMTSDTSAGSDPMISRASTSPTTPQEKPDEVDVSPIPSDPVAPHSVLPPVPPPATAPAFASRPEDALASTDYFGYQDHPISEPEPLSRESSSSATPPPPAPVIVREAQSIPEEGPLSVPALPRRVCLTRQTSSPLPDTSPPNTRYIGGRVPTESLASVKLGKAAKEERMFGDLGYLAPPYPPDELERRRALYKWAFFTRYMIFAASLLTLSFFL